MLLKKTRLHVLNVLKNNERTRSDDFILIKEVYRKIDPNILNKTFEEVMDNHLELGIPSFHSISRLRRYIFSKNPELKPIKATEEREKLEDEYKRFLRNE